MKRVVFDYLSSTWRCPFATCIRAYGVTKHDWEAGEMPVYVYGKGKGRNRVYAWGLAASGALGVREFLQPKTHSRILKHTFKPCLVPFSEKHKVSYRPS
ncbi:unnamed protein product [Soboliphyme baturini]|uniref:GST N-terminal domain-containing protein n=1 Tax=Soboliphyme baturini TaxID=241478 RepID=A0A183JA51_9BILA|nr:unnamed protein product [Soboliphyme baturini]